MLALGEALASGLPTKATVQFCRLRGDSESTASLRLRATVRFKFAQVAPSVATIAVPYYDYNSARETCPVASGQAAVREISLSSTAASAAKQDANTTFDAFTQKQVQITKFDPF